MVPTTIARISGDGKCSPAGSKLAIPLSVRVKNQDDEPMFDAPVDFTVTAGGGTVEPSSTLTDSAGIASSVLTLGPTPGLNQVEATADGLSVSFDITGLAPGYGGGTGEPNDPFQIWTAEQMNGIGAEPNDWGKHFELTADIDLSGFDGKEGRCMFNVIGNQAVPFTGVFNGGAHTIWHLTVEGGSYLGLFGKLGSGAKVMGLGVVDANIVGTGDYVAGLVGYNGGTVARCFCTGVMRGRYDVGGLVGYTSGGHLSACYSTAAVSGSSNVGGLVGRHDSWSWATELQCVWDTQTSGQSASAGGIGLTTAEMMDPEMLGLNGFANDPNWVLDAGRDYPRLAWESTAGEMIPEPSIDWLEGDGTAEAPYRIDAADQLMILSRASVLWDRHFVLGADLDLDPNLPNMLVFTQPPIQLFTGVFDGNDHTIAHLKIKGNDYLGLFGRLAYGGEIRNLGVVGVNIVGSGGDVGGLVAYNSGTVTQCYGTGAVSGDCYIGGLVGENHGTLDQCSIVDMVVNGMRWSVGGLCGYSIGHIQQCYNRGAVKGGWRVGGLVGEHGGILAHCYSTGKVQGSGGGLVGYNYSWSDSNDCFWDMQTSGRATSAGGIGLTTTEMQTAQTFLDAGWDFVSETANGTEDIWWILEGKDYPHLWWEAHH